jgi:threonine/homoserine/homoserine lactone efflux protein
MDLSLLVRGALIGLSVAAPVGPMGVLCIRRTLADGRAAGLATGLGIATADALYGSIAGFGIAVIAQMMLREATWIRLVGGVFLCYLGLKIFRVAPAQEAAQATRRGHFGAYSSALGLTLANPTTILSFVAIFAGVGVAGKASASAALLVLGVLLGSTTWWVILTSIVTLVRARLTPDLLRWVNRLSGCILLGFGLVALVSVAR